MKKNERRMILILVVIAIVVIAVLVKSRTSTNQGAAQGNKNNGGQTSQTTEKKEKEEFVDVLDDGTKKNKSDKLTETKKFGDYEVSNVQLTESNGQSLILADVKNISDKKTELTLVDITLLDKEGKEITTIGGILGEAEPGATVQLNASATADFANAYDISIKVSAQQ